MTKKILSATMALIMLFVASCQNELDTAVATGDTSTVTFSIETPELSTRAYSDGTTATDLQFAIFDLVERDSKGEISHLENFPATVTPVGTNKWTVSFKLVTGNMYKVVFWAAAPNAPYEFEANNDGATVTVVYTNAVCNDEARDAFYGKTEFTVDGNKTIGVNLTRPFAQLNIGTSDYADAEDANVVPTLSKVTVEGIANKLNLFTDEVTSSEDFDGTVTFDYATIPYTNDGDDDNDEDFPVAGYEYIAMNYLLVGAEDKTVVDVEFTCKDGQNREYTRTVGSVPVQGNYRTNIFGEILTSTAELEVEIKPGYENPDNLVYVWDGTEVAMPAMVNEDGRDIYVITKASELAWLAGAVNGTLKEEYTRSSVAANDFKGKTFRLTKDIDLGGQEWTPIGNSNCIFKGTLDGQGHVVKNLVITGYNSNVGLFGVTHDGEIKNLVVENAKVSGRLNVGVVAGQPYTSKYTDITVQGLVQVEGMAYVGGVGGKNAYADWTNITVDAANGSYVKANSIENGTAYRTYVGGVVGFNGEGGHTFKNITSNINVEGTTCDVGGLFGIAHYGNKFENCTCTGNVEITDAEEEAEEAQEIGGIAGVWHNENGQSVTFTNCSFTGTLTSNIEGVEFYYGSLVGKPYSATGTGKLIIGGKQYVATQAQLQAAINAAEDETTLYLGYNIEGNVTVVQKPGVKINIEGEGKKFNGSIKVHSNSNHYADAALTIKNVNFETSAASVYVIEALENGSERYSTNITIEGCTFTAIGEAVNTAVGVQIKSSKNAKVIGCTATNMHSLIQAQSCDETVTVKDCTVNGKNGVAFKQVKAATVEGTTITAIEYGIRFDGNTDNYGIVVKNNNVTAVQPFIVRKMTGKNNTIALEGTNTLTTEKEFQIVITNGSDDAEYVKPTGTYTLTGAEYYKIFPCAFPVATWDEFTAALAAGEDWIKLTNDIEYTGNYNLKKNIILDLNGKSITMPMFYVFSTATIKNGTINGKMYARTGCKATLEGLTFSGTISDDLSTEGHLQVQGGCDVYAKSCTFAATTVNGSQTRSLSIEASSSGTRKFENCDFKFVSWGNGAGKYKKNVYVNTMNGTTTVDFTNCKLNGKAPNILFAGTYSLTNLTMNGCDNTAPTLETNRAKDAITEAEWAHISSLIANNKFTQVRLFYAGGSSEYIKK